MCAEETRKGGDRDAAVRGRKGGGRAAFRRSSAPPQYITLFHQAKRKSLFQKVLFLFDLLSSLKMKNKHMGSGLGESSLFPLPPSPPAEIGRFGNRFEAARVRALDEGDRVERKANCRGF